MDWEKIAWPLGTLGLALGIGLAARVLVRHLLGRWARRTQSRFDDYVVAVVSRHILFWALLAGALWATPMLPVDPGVQQILRRTLTVLFLVSLTVLGANLAASVIPHAAQRYALPLSTTSFSANIIRLFIFVLGGLLILSNLGIAIGPLLTALGVGSLAVGLALQETLANLFSGFYLFLSQQFRVGDYIEFERGIGYAAQKGYVMDVNWRFTRLRTLSGTVIEVPNSFMTQAIIRQFGKGTDRAVFSIEVKLGHQADLEKAEALARKIAAAIGNKEAALQQVQFLSANEPIIMTLVFETPRLFEQERFTTDYIKRLRTELAQEQLL